MNSQANNAYPLTMLYDAACPVCALEMDHLRQRDAGQRLRFVDIAAPGFDAAAWGATAEALQAEIHVVRPDGSHVVGLAALRAAYAAAGLGALLAPTAWPLLRPLADAGYRWFARHRRRISHAAAPLIDVLRDARARHTAAAMARCAQGACSLQRPGTGHRRHAVAATNADTNADTNPAANAAAASSRHVGAGRSPEEAT